jgi:transcription elongation factor Elf1
MFEDDNEMTLNSQAASVDEGVEIDNADMAEDDADIRPTDIVFDCPHCGHNLVIDYRGAGLQTRCVECGEMIQVPIPEGMKLGDLDLNASELLVQLFQTRRMLIKSEQRIRELEEAYDSLKLRRTELEQLRKDALHKHADLTTMVQQCQKYQSDIAGVLAKMQSSLAEVVQK